MKTHSFWGLYIISFFDFLAGGLMFLIMITPFVYSFDNFFGKSVPIIIIFLYYLIWGGLGYICFLMSWKTLISEPDIRFGNLFVSMLLLIFAYVFSEFVSMREINSIKGVNPTWIYRLIYAYVVWSICYILQPGLKAKLAAYNYPE